MPTEQRSLKVFLCHAHSDKKEVRDLYLGLTDDGVDVWLDKEKLLPGQDWELEIRKAVRESDVVVVCLSNQFNQAGFRQKEVRLALDTAMEQPEGEIFIIPARLEECETLESLRKWHWVDLFEEDGYEMLMRALHARANKIGATLQMKKNWLPKLAVSRSSGTPISDNKPAKSKSISDKIEKPSGETAKQKTEKPEISKTKTRRRPNTAILVSLIGFTGTVIAGLLSSPLIEKWFSPTQTIEQSATATLPLSSQTVTLSKTIEPSQTPVQIFMPFLDNSATVTASKTIEPSQAPTPILTPLPKDYAIVPNVVGLKYSSAESELRKKGFKAQYNYVVRPDVSAGTIVQQTPSNGVGLKIGETILLDRTVYASLLKTNDVLLFYVKKGNTHYFIYEFMGGNSYMISVSTFTSGFDWEFTVALMDLDLHQIDAVTGKTTLTYSPSESNYAVIRVSNCCYDWDPGLKVGIKVTELH